jgi:RNA polymerase sigma factor (sigma-70 family)
MGFYSDKSKKFREAYNKYYPLVYNTLFYRLHNHDDAEDICQEVFVSFYSKIDKIDTPRQWLVQAVRFEISNHLRKKSNKVDKIDIDAVENDLMLAFVNAARDARILLKEAIECEENYESEEEKIIFNLVAINKYTYGQAARHLGLTKRKIEYRYLKTTSRVLKYLKNKGIKKIEDLL